MRIGKSTDPSISMADLSCAGVTLSVAAGPAADRGGVWAAEPEAFSRTASAAAAIQLRVANIERSVNRLEGELEIGLLVLRERHRVDAGVAGRAIGAPAIADRLPQPVQTEIGEGVGLEEVPNLLDRVSGSDQILAARRVDAVEAGGHRRRTADADVDLACAGGFHQADDLPAGRAADDRVVHEHHALVLEDAADRVQLHLDAEVADRLLRLDE